MTKEAIGDSLLYHGDALEILPMLGPVDLVCTDPPYLLTSGGCSEGGLHERFGGGGVYENSGEIVPCSIDWPDFMPPIFDVLRDPGHAYFMANNRNVQAMLDAAEAAGFYFHNLLVWDKITATPNRWYMKNLEFTGFFGKGRAFNISDCSQKQLIRCPQVDETTHPTEKPVALMRNYIEMSSKKGETVLDPFSGSCSTGVAAIQAGRRFIGIEKDARFFDMGVHRLWAAVNDFQEELF
jgi:DNA modification methylase